MKVFSIYYTHKPGGLCKRLYRLLNRTALRGHEVHYLTLDTPAEGMLDEKVRLHRIPYPLRRRKGLVFWGSFTVIAFLYSAWLARKVRPERYVVFHSYYVFILAFARKVARAPLVIFFRALNFEINRFIDRPAIVESASRYFDRYAITHVDRVVCITKVMAEAIERFIGAPLDGCAILPNNVPVPTSVQGPAIEERYLKRIEEAREKHALILLTAGVLDKRKNVLVLLEALTQVSARRGPDSLFLLVAGDGSSLPALKAFVEQHRLRNVIFLGWVNNLEALLYEVDLVVHPSLHEGMSNAILETLAVGRPVISSDTPEARELLHYPELLFAANSAHELTAALEVAVQNRSHVEHLRELCQDRSASYRFDWDERACELVVR